MTDNRAKALEAFELCRQYRRTPQGDMVLELMEPLVFDWFCKNEETIREALSEPKWKSMDSIPANGQFLCAWPEVKLDEDGDMTEEKTGKYFIGSADRSCGQSNGEPDSLNSMGEWYGDDTCWASEPTHWMHLPDAPTGGES